MSFVRKFLKLTALGTVGSCGVLYYWLYHTNDFYRNKHKAIKFFEETTGKKLP